MEKSSQGFHSLAWKDINFKRDGNFQQPNSKVSFYFLTYFFVQKYFPGCDQWDPRKSWGSCDRCWSALISAELSCSFSKICSPSISSNGEWYHQTHQTKKLGKRRAFVMQLISLFKNTSPAVINEIRGSQMRN